MSQCQCHHVHPFARVVCACATVGASNVAMAESPIEAPEMRAERQAGPPISTEITKGYWLSETETTHGGLFALVTGIDASGAALELGHAEFNLAFELRALTVETVLAWGGDGIEPAILQASVRLYGSGPALVRGDTELVLSGGRMDVPIGSDFEQYAASDRPMVSLPLLVDGTHGGWNAFGAQLVVTGEDYEARFFGAQAFEAADPEAAAPSLGAWARLQLAEGFSTGLSAAAVFDRAGQVQASLGAVDATFEWAGFQAKAEALAMRTSAQDETATSVGAYLQVAQSLGRFMVAARADLLSGPESLDRRLALCASVQVLEDSVMLRAEVNSDFGPEPDAVLLQTVVVL